MAFIFSLIGLAVVQQKHKYHKGRKLSIIPYQYAFAFKYF